MAAAAMEWWWHCDYNIVESAAGERCFFKGMVILFTVFPLLFLIRPICPRGIASKILAMVLAGVGAVFTMIVFSEFYNDSFRIFANADFGIALIFVAGLFVGGILLKRAAQEEYNVVFATIFTLAAIFVLWVLLTEQIYLYWYCRNRFAEEADKIPNWRFLSHMYISVMWAAYGAALMVVGFWRKVPLLRYIALGLFVLLLAKVFILDTSRVKNVYRIAAFLATGVTLVGVSYLYQFLRKKGFFDAMLVEKSSEK
jgi:MFS family permease